MGGDMGIAFSIEVFQVVPNLSQVVHPNIDLTLGKDTDAVRCRIFIPDMSLHMKIYVLEIRGVDVDRIGRFGRILLIDPKEDSVASETDTKIYSMAGADDRRPRMTADEMRTIVRHAGLRAVERDTLYNEL